MSDKYRDARIGTFRDSWPHENKKGWKCKVAKVSLLYSRTSFTYETSSSITAGIMTQHLRLMML